MRQIKRVRELMTIYQKTLLRTTTNLIYSRPVKLARAAMIPSESSANLQNTEAATQPTNEGFLYQCRVSPKISARVGGNRNDRLNGFHFAQLAESLPGNETVVDLSIPCASWSSVLEPEREAKPVLSLYAGYPLGRISSRERGLSRRRETMKTATKQQQDKILRKMLGAARARLKRLNYASMDVGEKAAHLRKHGRTHRKSQRDPFKEFVLNEMKNPTRRLESTVKGNTDMIPPVNSDLLTKADREALYRMPEGWFDSDDLFPSIRRSTYRCDRLHKLGYLDYDVIGTYPHLEARYRKKQETKAVIEARYR